MSLIDLIKVPMKLLRKDVITFVIIRRFDLNSFDERLRYIAVKPSASISVLREKVWHLLDLPDFCDEIITLKSNNDTIIPLTKLRTGTDPHHPYILEVWPPDKMVRYAETIPSTTVNANVLRIQNGDQIQHSICTKTEALYEHAKPENDNRLLGTPASYPYSTKIDVISPTKKHHLRDTFVNNLVNDCKRSLSAGGSSSSIFKLSARKSRDNVAHILIKIQSDLSTLSNKLSNLESKMAV